MNEKATNIFEPKATNKMELNKLSVSVISVLVTLAICLAGFSYRIGGYNNELVNIKEQQITIKNDNKEYIETVKNDFKEDLAAMEESKAEKETVNLLFQKIDNVQTTQNEILNILIQSKIGEK